MRTCVDGWRSVTVIAAVGALAFSVVAYGTPDKRGVTRGPISVTERYEAVDPNLPVVLTLDDATTQRGGVASVPVAGAPVYLQNDSCLYGNFLTDDDTSGLGGWWGQARFDCPPGFPLCDARGWQAGDAITGYEVSNFLCSSSSANDCIVEVELWDGDPLGAMDTVCNPTPAPIAGTKTAFSGLSRAVFHTLRAQLPAPVTYNCDRVWIVVSLVGGCRGSWLLGGQDDIGPAGCRIDPADIGWGDGYGFVYGCQQFGYCATPSGYGAGTCCTTGQECDYTDADPNNWTGDCNLGGTLPPFFTHPTFCSDGYADYYFTNYAGAPAKYYAQPGAVYAATDVYMQWTPVHADSPPGDWSISGNEITLKGGGAHIWMEIRITDVDPLNSPNVINIRSWQADLDSSGYYAGLQGALAPWMPTCTSDADCEGLIGSLGMGGAKGGCGVFGFPAGHCAAAFIDNTRTDYVFYMQAEVSGINATTIDYRYGSTLPGTWILAPDFETYAGTLLLDVSVDAMGTFYVGFEPVWSIVTDDENSPIPLMGLVPAKIIIGTGQCCNMSANPPVCIDDTVTATECEALGSAGGFAVHHDVNKTCADDCPPDCNNNGVPDEEDISSSTSEDCNSNGIPDECEIPVSSGGLCTVDCDPDCNTNAIPDECDIAECTPGDPDCDDCNLNGVPDWCDIDSGTSLDVDPADGVPDECAEFIGGCVSDKDWDCYDNWNIPGEVYPNNSEVSTYSVTLDGIMDDVFLNVTVEIDTLELLDHAKVSVTQVSVGDLSVVAPGGIYNEGFLLVANDRQISVTSGSPKAGSRRQNGDTGGGFTIGPCGTYGADDDLGHSGCPGDLMCASLSAGSVTILPGDCEICFVGGQMTLEEAMSVGVTGDIVLKGSPTPTCPGWSRRNSEDLTLRGITPPPKLRLGERSTVSAGVLYVVAAAEPTGVGNFIMTGAAETINDSTVGMALAGDFDNRSTYPSLFKWANGKLTLNGTDVQTFEVAGLDLGPVAEGFSTDQGTLFEPDPLEPHQNYAIGTMILEGAPENPPQITFINSFANTAGPGPCDEALYVDTLILQTGSTITLEDCRVYYRNLVDNGANIEWTGCGEFVDLCAADPPTKPVGEAGYEKVRYISMEPGNPGRQTALRVNLKTLPSPFAGFNSTKCWVGEPQQVSENSGKIAHEPGWPDFMSANQQGSPHCMDWSTVGVLHVTDDDIIPSAVYEVQAIDCTCDFENEANYSAPLTITTSKWGDLVGTCAVIPCSPPEGVVNMATDVTACLDKFRNLPGAVMKSRADIEPNFPDWLVNISDVTYILDAFRGFAYPPAQTPPAPGWPGPDGCP